MCFFLFLFLQFKKSNCIFVGSSGFFDQLKFMNKNQKLNKSVGANMLFSVLWYVSFCFSLSCIHVYEEL